MVRISFGAFVIIDLYSDLKSERPQRWGVIFVTFSNQTLSGASHSDRFSSKIGTKKF
jgi:hypothetical protein